ncbi:MAG TPA: DUF1552 domain-containing protein [Polyangiaceae bacterium]|nr:DUF1552 domain-containing protein [Polyangiaceae bacterium]
MRNWSRREFMRHAGLAAAFSPFLSVLDPKLARAQAAPGRAKYLLLFCTNGTDTRAWSPAAGSSDTSIAFSTMTEPLAPIKDKLILIEKLDSNGSAGQHAQPGGLTGQNYGGQNIISIDQFAADGLRANGVITQVPSLMLGGVPSQEQRIFYRGGKKLSPIAAPATAYQAIFGGAMSAPSAGGAPVVDNRTGRRASILSLLKGEISQLSQSLGRIEREKLDIHLASIQQLEARIATVSGGGGPTVVAGNCATPASPADGGQDLLNSVIHLDLAINAFACDITRVAAVEFGNDQSAQVSIPEVGDPGDWHNTFTHGDNPRTRLTNLERWLCQQFVAAADKLKSLPAPDGNGTLFDQTLMVWTREMGDAVEHRGDDMRFVFAGGAGGYLRTSPNGRYIDAGGDAHQRALISCAEALGITNFAGFGATGGAAESRTALESLRA